VNKEKRVRQAVREYLGCASILSAKLNKSLLELCDQSVDPKAWKTLAYYHGMLDKHIDLVDHRLLQNQSIPAAEKVYSLFEPHTEWIQKGKRQPQRRVGSAAPCGQRPASTDTRLPHP